MFSGSHRNDATEDQSTDGVFYGHEDVSFLDDANLRTDRSANPEDIALTLAWKCTIFWPVPEFRQVL